MTIQPVIDWTFATSPAKVKELFGEWHFPFRELKLSEWQIKGLAEGRCVVIFTGEALLFLSRQDEDVIHNQE